MKAVFPRVFIAALAATTLAAPVRNAAAWSEVCVHLPAWRTWFAAHFYVVHDFDAETPGLPALVLDRPPPDASHLPPISEAIEELENQWQSEARRLLPWLPDVLRNNRGGLFNTGKEAYALKQSSTITAGQTRCVSIDDLRRGAPFFVLVDVHHVDGLFYCEIQEDAARRNPWYPQQNRARKMVYVAEGRVFNPSCYYSWEEN